MKVSRRQFSRSVAAVLTASLVPLAAQAQKFPDKPIRIINTFSAGGPSDAAARAVAQLMADILGQSVVVENKPGGASMIAASYVASQPADGYTLLLSNNQVTSNPLLYKRVPYKNTDFAPVGLIMKSVNAMIVPASLPVKNVREFVEYARASKDKINYAIFGPGGTPHVNGKMLEKSGGISMVEVSYKGGTEATQDVMAGRVQALFVTSSGGISSQATGKVRILGITGAERLEGAPDLPTFKEQGYDVVSYSWFGLMAPAGTPRDRIDILNRAIVRAVNSAEYQQKMKAGGTIPSSGSPEDMASFLKADYAAWEAILKPMNLQLD
ncbi:MAG: tripartite tricarboxylate transporter substrate binding protein [Burkholderiaceae bacterium]|nr:tripartite tricarboxylate transporter substrate binding protein [Burkholderiaceae bacterium]